MRARAWVAFGCALVAVIPALALAQNDDDGDVVEKIDLGPPRAAHAPDAGPADGGDVTESIDLGSGAPTARPRPTPSSAAPLEESVEARAWLRVGTELGLDRVGRYADAPDPFAVPHDRVVGRGQMHLRLRYARGKKYEVVASGLLGYGVFEEDSKYLVPFIGVNGQHARTEFEATLREAYVGFFWPIVDLRVGNQRIAWGKGDMFAPNDIINPRDLRDPVLGEAEVQRIPSFALRFDLDAGAIGLQAVAVPFFRPDRFDLYGSNWAALQLDAPAPYRGLMSLQTAITDPTLEGALQPIVGQTADLPEDDLSAASGGLRLRWNAGGFDGNVYLQYGLDSTPLTSVDPQFAQALAGIDFNMATAASLKPVLDLIDTGIRPSRSEYVRRIHQGADIETNLGERWVVRLDGAYDSQMVFTRRSDFTGIAVPSIQVVGAAEYQTGEVGRTFLLEAWYQQLSSKVPPDGELLGVNKQNAAIGALWRWSWSDELIGLELRAVVGVSPRSYLLVPRITTKVGQDTVIGAGALVLDGADNSQAHYYRHNRGAFAFVKYSY